MTKPDLDDYNIAIICALPVARAAVIGMVDEEHDEMTVKAKGDQNAYFRGKIHKHNVFIALQTAEDDGKAAASLVAKDILRTFRSLKFCLLVGIGRGIPDLEAGHDMRLGYVVVTQPTATFGGVMQFDEVKATAEGRWVRKGSLSAPPKALRTALAALQGDHEISSTLIPSYVAPIFYHRPSVDGANFAYPEVKDTLYESDYIHPSGDTSYSKCHTSWSIDRKNKKDPTFARIHYGTIASSKEFVRDTMKRDEWRKNCGALCVEVAAAGLRNDCPCLVIRGIADYADSHRNDQWHRYAPATAAAFAKELLSCVSPDKLRDEKSISQVLGK